MLEAPSVNRRAVEQALLLELRRSRHRLALARRARAAAGRADDPVFVVSAGRTGSQLLADYLNCLPGVTVLGEVLNASKLVGLPARLTTRRGAERHLRHCIDALPGPVRGAKLLFSQLEDHGLSLERLRELFPGVRFLVLYRRSLADQYVSLRMAGATGRYAARSVETPAEGRIYVDAHALQGFYERVKARYATALASPSVRERSAVVCYEELAADPQRLVDQTLCPFLGVAPATVATTLVKQNRRSLSEVVANYHQVRHLLTGEASTHQYG